MLSNIKIEFYPLWMKSYPELFEKSKAKFFTDAKDAGLNTITEYWQNGLFYMEAA